MDMPWGLLKVNRAPSLRTGKAECRSQLSQQHQKGITRTSAIGPNVSITHLILPTALSHVFDRSSGTVRFMAPSARWRAKPGFSVLVGDISSQLCGIVLPVSTGWRCDGGKRCSGTGNGIRPGIVASSVGILGGLLYGFGGVITVMSTVT
jgi:hypothetical protein